VNVLNHAIAELREDVRITILTIVEHLKDSNAYVRVTAIELLSKLGAQGMCWHHFWQCAQAFL